MCSVLSEALRGEGRSLCGLQGVQCIGKLYLRRWSQSKGNFMTGQRQKGCPVWCLSEHIIEQVYGSLFISSQSSRTHCSGTWSLQVDKADLSWHVHGPLKIGYLKWRLPCYRAFIFVGFPPWFPGRNMTLRMSGTPNRGLPTYKSVTWQDLKCPCLVPRNEFQTLP